MNLQKTISILEVIFELTFSQIVACKVNVSD